MPRVAFGIGTIDPPDRNRQLAVFRRVIYDMPVRPGCIVRHSPGDGQMRNGLKRVAFVMVFIAAGAGMAEARFTVANRAGKSVWMTLYDGFGKQMSSLCMTDNRDNVWAGGNFLSTKIGSPGETLYLRGELKESSSCGGKTLSDTGRGATIMVGKDTVKTFSIIDGRLRVS